MAHGEHELKEWMKIYEEDDLLSKYLGGGSRKFFKNEKFNLNRDEKITSAEIKDLQEDIEEIEKKPTARELDGESFTNRLSAHVAIGLGIGATVVALNSNNIDSAIPAIALGSSIFSGIVGYINNKCYEKKPITNTINQYIINKKRRQLEASSETLNQIHQKQKLLADQLGNNCTDSLNMYRDDISLDDTIEK